MTTPTRPSRRRLWLRRALIVVAALSLVHAATWFALVVVRLLMASPTPPDLGSLLLRFLGSMLLLAVSVALVVRGTSQRARSAPGDGGGVGAGSS